MVKITKPKKWEYAEERKVLIKAVEKVMDKKHNKCIAMDLVDACILSAWQYQKNKTLFVTGDKLK